MCPNYFHHVCNGKEGGEDASSNRCSFCVQKVKSVFVNELDKAGCDEKEKEIVELDKEDAEPTSIGKIFLWYLYFAESMRRRCQRMISRKILSLLSCLYVTMEIVLVEGGEWVGGIVTAVEGDTVKVTNKNYL
jgi:hypothetical protein